MGGIRNRSLLRGHYQKSGLGCWMDGEHMLFHKARGMWGLGLKACDLDVEA